MLTYTEFKSMYLKDAKYALGMGRCLGMTLQKALYYVTLIKKGY